MQPPLFRDWITIANGYWPKCEESESDKLSRLGLLPLMPSNQYTLLSPSPPLLIWPRAECIAAFEHLKLLILRVRGYEAET